MADEPTTVSTPDPVHPVGDAQPAAVSPPATTQAPSLTTREAPPAPTGADTAAGSTEAGTATEGGASTEAGTDSATGTDSIGGDTSGGDTGAGGGSDSLSSASYDVLAAPDGVAVDDTLMGKFKEVALDSKLPPDKAQAVLALLPSVLEAQRAANQEAFNTTVKGWETQVLASPDFNTADKKTASFAAIGRFIDEFGSQEVRDVFDATGAGSHPALISMILKAARSLGEARPTPAGNPGPGGKLTYAEKTYGAKP